jgi:hypothetical protein
MTYDLDVSRNHNLAVSEQVHSKFGFDLVTGFTFLGVE